MSMILWLLMLLLQILFSSANSENKIILSLYRRSSTNNNNNNPLDILKGHADTSLYRAQNHHHLLKHNDVKVPLYPGSFSEYMVNLGFGTPPQTLPFTMDTGSSLTWFPCTYKYICTNCNSTGLGPAYIPTFIPKKSSSSKIVPCQSKQCEWLFPGLQCKKTQKICGYTVIYGTGNTSGLLLNETLALGGSVVVDDFTVGCSVSSAGVPDGIVGFGRDPESLPAQMGLTSFTYCMVSHDFNGNPFASSDLVLTTSSSSSGDKGEDKFDYTPFLDQLSYYIKLQSISVDGADIKVPAKYLERDDKGYGGTLIDSGTTVAVMEKPVFDLVFGKIQGRVGNKYKRFKMAENQTGLKPCYRVPAADVGKNKTMDLPQLTFSFKGGVDMVFPVLNYFSYADKKRSVLCMTIRSLGDQVGMGPAITLGNYMQQDYYMKYDLENNRLGFRQHNCK